MAICPSRGHCVRKVAGKPSTSYQEEDKQKGCVAGHVAGLAAPPLPGDQENKCRSEKQDLQPGHGCQPPPGSCLETTTVLNTSSTIRG